MATGSGNGFTVSGASSSGNAAVTTSSAILNSLNSSTLPGATVGAPGSSVPAGTGIIQYNASTSGSFSVPAGVVGIADNSTANTTIIGNGASNQSVVSGNGSNLTFQSNGGSGVFAATGGNNVYHRYCACWRQLEHCPVQRQ